jgi:DDE superfamily endonuclease
VPNGWTVLRINPGAADRALFPPVNVVEIKALACELPTTLGLPFSRLSNADIAREAVVRGVVVAISVTTVRRFLHSDAIKPWMHHSWLFPRDPFFAEKAVRVLDLYFRVFEGIPLGPDDYVISSDEKTSIQARHRKTICAGPMPHQPRRVEFEYERKGSLAYLAAWDVHRPKLFGICEKTTGIEAYHKLVDSVMQQEPYRSARRVFWITDNGSSHRGESSVQRLSEWYPNAIQIHTPIHASWLNQVEIFFSILQRKILTPNDFPDLETLEIAILQFQALYNEIARPFKWKYTKDDLKKTLSKIHAQEATTHYDRLAA